MRYILQVSLTHTDEEVLVNEIHRLREELLTEATQSVRYQGLFYWFYDHDLIGVMAIFVDDIISAGTKSWRALVMESLKTTFSFGPESSEMFTYIGIELKQTKGAIKISQANYIETIKTITISNERLDERHNPITEQESTFYRTAIGQLNLVTGISRPEISFDVCLASTKVKSATVSDMIAINKTI